MNTLESKTAKRSYIVPIIERIKLDNEISLVLESSSPVKGPWESLNKQNSSDYFNNDPFKGNLG